MKTPLPPVREGMTHCVLLGDVKLYITVNLMDGRPVEVFGKCAEHQGELDGLCILASVAMRYGTPASELARHLRFRNYPPHGLPSQPCSISDALGRVLQLHIDDT